MIQAIRRSAPLSEERIAQLRKQFYVPKHVRTYVGQLDDEFFGVGGSDTEAVRLYDSGHKHAGQVDYVETALDTYSRVK